MKHAGKTIAARIAPITMLAVLTLNTGIFGVMIFFMHSTTDRILLQTLQALAKTTAQGVEGNLHTLADRFFLIKANRVFNDPVLDLGAIRSNLDYIASGIEFVWLGLYRSDGTLLAGTGDSPGGISHYKLTGIVKYTGNLVIADTAAGSQGLEVVMGLPVNGNILAGSYRYDILSDVIGNINVGAGGSAFIINEEGTFVAHQDLNRVFGKEVLTRELGAHEQGRKELVLMLEGQTGSALVPGVQGTMFLAYSPIRGTRWSLGILVPRSSFTGPLRDAMMISIIFTAAALVCFILIFTAAIRKILSLPLQAITESARRLAEGVFEDRLPRNITERKDEIGRLGEAYFSVAASIKQVIEDIGLLTKAARSGSLYERAGLEPHKGDYHLIITGINAMMDVFCSHFDVMPAALALFNAESAPIYINKNMTDILKRHGFHFDDPRLLSMILAKPSWRALFDPREGLGVFRDEISISGPDGELWNYSVMLQQILDEQSVIMILQDITQLTRARLDAEAASTAKSNFLANMSHEMRTPMNAIIGMTSLAKSSDGMERKDYCLDKIENASRHLLGVINDVLDMSKIEADKFELSLQEFSPEKMIRRLSGVISSRLEEKNQTFTVELDGAVPAKLTGDEQRLAQVITNLLSNAVKFTPEGGSIRLGLKPLSQTEETIVIQVEVADTGIGISEEQQGRLFNLFQQADSSISRRFGGTGLGLAISKRIVEMMNGAIWVNSRVGEGSVFAFSAELQKAAETPENGAAGDASAAAAGTDSFRGRSLLLAEDVEINREIVLALLEPTGIAVDCAENGVEALRMFGENPGKYDLIFMDIHMPEMDGYETTRRIRALEKNSAIMENAKHSPQSSGRPTGQRDNVHGVSEDEKTCMENAKHSPQSSGRPTGVPIIAMTANVFRQDIENCLAAGMNDHIGKPLDFGEVLEKMRRYLGGTL